MARKKHILNILVKGGIITPSHLSAIVNVATENENTSIGFGSRQQILVDVLPENILKIETLLANKGYEFEWVSSKGVKQQNIVSSFAAYDISPSTFWVSSDTYLSALDQFKQSLKLRVNLVDPRQKLIPCYSGNLNFVASQKENYWHLAIKNIQNKKIYSWPVLVHQDDIGSLSHMLEIFWEDKIDLALWYEKSLVATKFKNLKSNTELPENTELPAEYEGFNRMESGNYYWAGFLWRNNQYNLQFLEELCTLCLRSNVARISITPWKSFLIKNIKPTDLILWEQLTGRFGINMRHSSFDLYWHLPYANKQALQLKNRIVRKMDKLDIRTYGLTFSIGNSQNPFTTVLIKEKLVLGRFNLPLFNQYDIYYAKNFDTRSGEYQLANKNITYKEIHKILIELSKRFYIKLTAHSKTEPPKAEEKLSQVNIHQCTDCLSIYHSAFGDPGNNIAPGTAFADLSESFSCSTCGACKDRFEPKEMDASMFLAPDQTN